MPNEVSLFAKNIKDGSKTLKQRRDFSATNKQFIFESIENDVRTCGLLVTDLTKDNTFELKQKYIFKQVEIRDFFGERLANNIKEDKPKKLFTYLVTNYHVQCH